MCGRDGGAIRHGYGDSLFRGGFVGERIGTGHKVICGPSVRYSRWFVLC